MADARQSLDHTLIRIKDFLLIAGSLAAFGFWALGILSLPDQVKKHEERIKILESRAATNDVTINAMQKDVNYMTKSIEEIKDILKRHFNGKADI